MTISTNNYIMNDVIAGKKLLRMAYEILENNLNEKEIILAGIRESGSVVARNIQKLIAGLSPLKTEIITISLDKKHPNDVVLNKAMDFNNKVIIVIDDVANSGRTLLYALKPFLGFHPKKIQTLVLIDRTHKAFPINPDYVGISIATTLQDHIYVEVDSEKILGAYLK